MPVFAYAYSQGTYYSQGGYYQQGYYQASYTGGCGNTVVATLMQKNESIPRNIGAAFLRDALISLTGVGIAYAYSQGSYYTQAGYYHQGYYQGTYNSLGTCITAIPFSAGAGGVAPASYAYFGGGGGGGIILNGSTVSGGDGYVSTGNGGKGYGGGGGGSGSTGSSGAGGNGAPGVVYIEWQDQYPTIPTVSGPSTLARGSSGSFTFTSTDPESDPIRYGIDWDNDGSIDAYVPSSGYVSSGTSQTISHVWNSTGTQSFEVLAADDGGAYSNWVLFTLTVTDPAPTVLLTASPASISTGGSSTLTWSSSYATSCTGTNFSTGSGSPTSGTKVVSPTVTTTYTVTCTGVGGSGNSAKTVTFTCTPNNVCSAGNLVNSCTGALVQSCGYGCGANTCTVPPPPQVISTPSAGLTGALQAKPSLVRSGATTKLYWNVSNVSSCTVDGGSDHWSDAAAGCSGTTCTSGAGGKTSSVINQRTIYTLQCTGVDSSATTSSATVNLLPIFQEQ